MTFKDYISEESWISNIDDYKIEYNDTKLHDMVKRIHQRVSDNVKEIKDKIYKGIEYIIKKDKKGFFKNRTQIGLFFKKSEFTLALLINPAEKYIRVNTILDKNMVFKHGLKWDLNEFKEIFFDIDCDNNTCFNFDSFILDESTEASSFMVEPNEDTGIPDVYLLELQTFEIDL